MRRILELVLPGLIAFGVIYAAVNVPLPPLPPKRYKAVTVSRGATDLLKQKPRVIVLPPPREWVFPWNYGTNRPVVFRWDIETGTGGVWTVLATNVTGAYTVTVNHAESKRLYRIHGITTP